MIAAVRPVFVAAGVLAALTVWPWLPPHEPPPPREAAAAPPPALAALPPPSAFAAVTDRPLFSPSRRPAAAPAGAAQSPLESRYRLVGVVIAGSERHALVSEGKRHLELRLGSTLEGWVVTGIAADRVTLASPAGEAVLRLK